MGAKAISEALSDAPHVEDIGLSFRDSALWPASEFQRILRASLPYKLIEVAYQPPLKWNYGPDEFFPEKRWELRVNPVRPEQRQEAEELLKKQGFPAIIEWLRLSHQPGWDARRHSLALVFNPAGMSLMLHREDGA
jgi:hypothetical protein